MPDSGGPESPEAEKATSAGKPSRSRAGELRQWYTVLASQASHYFRTNRFLGLFGFVVGISCLTFVFELQLGIGGERAIQLGRVSEYLSNFISLTPLWIILSAAFFAGDALCVDFSTGTGYYMLVLPVHRRTLLAGRYASAALATLAIVAVYFLFAILGAFYFFGVGTVPWDKLGIAFGLAVVFLLASLSVAFCISAFLRSAPAGVLVTVLALYVGFTTLQGAVELAGYEPWWSLTYAGNAMAAVLDTDYVHVQSTPIGSGQSSTLWMASQAEGTVIMTIYLAIFLVLSLYLYSRKESTG
jgi:ABC-type transport system involved in multi-copper enzyme maturation permease subunit